MIPASCRPCLCKFFKRGEFVRAELALERGAKVGCIPNQERRAQCLEHELKKQFHIGAGLRGFFNRCERCAPLAFCERADERVHLFAPRCASCRLYFRAREFFRSVPEKTFCKTESASRYEPSASKAISSAASGSERIAFFLRNGSDHLREHRARRLFKLKYLATRLHRLRHFFQFGRRENEYGVPGGSSSVFKNAFHADLESMCTRLKYTLCRVTGTAMCRRPR